MASDLSDLYQEIIMDHRRRPRNMGRPEDANRSAEGFNPFCGDRFTVYLTVNDGIISDIGFEGQGCAISTASASMLTEALMGKTTAEAMRLFESFHAMLTDSSEGEVDLEELGDLEALAGVREFPVRIKCAVLSWHTLKAALEQSQEAVTTE